MGHKLGYARTSTKEQRLDLQLDALKAAGVQERWIFRDQLSGTREDRPDWQRCLSALQPGNTLVVWKLDRLARSLAQTITLLKRLQELEVVLDVLEGPFAHTSPYTAEGKLLYAIFAAVAEFEHDVIQERVKAGMRAAQRRGKHCGRPPALSLEQQEMARDMQKAGHSVSSIARNLQCARETVYKALRSIP